MLFGRESGVGYPDVFGLSGEWCRGEGELEAVEAFFCEGRSGEGFLEEVTELVGYFVGGGESGEFKEFTGGGDDGEGEGSVGLVGSVVKEVEIEGG